MNHSICSGTSSNPLTSVSLPTGGNGTYTYSWLKLERNINGTFGSWTTIPDANQISYSPGILTKTTQFLRKVDSPPCSSGSSNIVTITVNEKPTVNSASSKAVCSGTAVNYQPTADVDFSSFTWTASTAGTITGFTASGSGIINNVLTLPSGSSSSQTITYRITPTGPAPTLCTGTPFDLVVTVNPTPTVTNATLTKEICAGETTDAVTFQSNVPSTTFSWTASSATSGLAGYRMSGTGDLPAMQIFSPLLSPGTITYTVTPHSPANCDGPSASYVITVKPAPSVINIPMNQTRCSGQASDEVVLTSNKPDPTFTWNATASNADVSNFTTSGTNTIPVQTITNASNVQGVVSYTIVIGGNFAGCVGSPMDYKIFVNPKPSAIATPSAQSICSGVKTDIALTSSVANTTFNWTASGPGSITGFSNSSGLKIAQTLVNSSNEPQDVTYTITPSSEGCTGTPLTVVVKVFPSPALTTTPLSKPICSGSSTAINLTSTPTEANFSWTVTGAGVTGYSNGTGTTIDQTLTNNTTSPKNVVYDITTSANGCSVHSNYTITVNPIPTVTNSPLSTSVCSGSPFSLPLTSNVSGTTFNWAAVGTTGISGQSNGTGTAISQTLVNSTSSTGTVTYTITPVNSCSGTAVNYTVTVNPLPNVNLSLANQTVCSGISASPVTFSTTVPGTTYTWTATPSGTGISGYTASGAGSIPSEVIINSSAAQRTVTYTVTPHFSACSGSGKTHVVTINPLPSPSISGPSSICAGSTGNVYTAQPGMTNYAWTISGGSITENGGSNSSNATVTWNTAGSGSIRVNYTDANGCTVLSPVSKSVTVNQIPVGTATPASIAVCSEQPFTINLGSSMGSGTTYSWSLSPTSLSGPLTGTSNPVSASYSNIGTVPEIAHFTITPSNSGCPGLPFNADVTVNPLPTISISGNTSTATGATEIYTTQSGMSNYAWTLNPSNAGTIISGGTTNAVTVSWISTSGQLCVNYKNPLGCNASATKCITVNASAVPATFDVTPVNGTYCEGAADGEGSIVGLSNSQGNIRYELIRNGGGVWDTRTGSSGAFNFSRPVNVAGTYRIKATNTSSGTSVWMNKSIVVTEAHYPIYSISSTDQHFCSEGHSIGVSGSETNVKYWLMLNGNSPDTTLVAGIAGTGLPNLNFGNPATPGAYKIYASKNGSGCALILPGTNWIEPKPASFELMPSGEFCAGEVANYWLSGSQPGFKYELHNKTTNVYSPAFTGNSDGGKIDFGPLLSPGVYEVIATDIKNSASTFCQTIMINNVTIRPNPSQNYIISPQGAQCEGVTVNLSSSEAGIWYHLYRMQTSSIPLSDTPFSSRLGNRSALNFGAPAEGGLYKILAVSRWSSSDSCSVWLPGSIDLCKRPLVKDISPFGHVCEVSEIRVLNPQIDVTYELIKDGDFSAPVQSITANPTVIFTPGQASVFEPGTYRVRGVSSCEPKTCDRMMNGDVIIGTPPSVNIGVNESVCLAPSSKITLSGTASHYNTNETMIQWIDLTSSGVFSNPNKLITDYTPNSNSGKRIFQLIVRGIDGCSDVTVSDEKEVDIRIPGVTAGANDTICGLSPYILAKAKADYAVSYAWTTSGTGLFSNQYRLMSTYYPSQADMNNGSVVLTLAITDECGNKVSSSMTLTLGQIPAALFTRSTNACSNSPVKFIDQSSATNGFIKKWVWDFGDGTQKTVLFPDNPNVSHIFPETVNSAFIVKLKVYTSLGCSSEYQQTVSMLKAPVANYSYSNISCDNLPVQFTNTSQVNGAASLQPWSWDFGDPVSGINNTSALLNPTHQFMGSGKYTIRLIVLNSNNCLDTISNTINIKPHPSVEYTFGNTCLNEPVNFSPEPATNNNSIKTWQWDFGDGIKSNIKNTVHSFEAPGSYNVTLSATDTVGCESSVTHSIKINPLPIAHFSAVKANCASTTVNFNELTSTSTGYVMKWTWDFGDGKTQTVQHPNNPNVTHVYTKTGTYDVKLTIQTSDNCSNSEIQKVLILPNPVANFNYAEFCNDLSVSFSDLTQNNGGGNLLNWSWSFGDPNSGVNNTSTFKNPVHLFSAAGSYLVALTVSNSDECKNTMTQTVVITERLLSKFSFSSIRCESDTVSFTNESTTPPSTAITSYLWDFGDSSTSTLKSPAHVFSAYGTYIVSLKIVNSSGCISSSTQQVSVNRKPVADFSVSEIRCSGNPVSFTDHSFITIGNNNFIKTWVWDFGDGSAPVKIDYPSVPDTRHIFNPGASAYKVRLTVTSTSGCSDFKEINLAVNTAAFNGTYGPYCDSDAPVILSAVPSGGVFSGLGVQGNRFNPVAAGVGFHTISYTSPAGSCPVDPISVNVVSIPVLKTTPQYVKNCNDTTDLTLPSVTAGSTLGLFYTYFADQGAKIPIANPKAVMAGTYYIRGATMSGKCFEITPVNVIQTDSLKASLSSVSPTCDGGSNGSITVVVTKGKAPFTFKWDTNPIAATHTITGIKAGIYSVTVTDANLCSLTLSTAIVDHPNVKIHITHKDLLCMNDANGSARVDSITFGKKSSDLGLYTFKWSTNPVQTTREATRLDNRYYSVTLTDAKGCGIKDSVYIAVLDSIPPKIECGNDTVNIVLQSVNYDPLGNAQSEFTVELTKPQVSDNCGIASLTNDAPSQFRLGITEVIWTATDFVGLSDTCKQFIYVKALPQIPKMFSPNGDNINDYFEIDGLSDFPKSQLSVFTRSGQLVFSSEDYHNEWDAKFATSTWSHNKLVAPGVYYYILNLGGTTQKIKGFIYIYY